MTQDSLRPIGIELFCGVGGMSLGFELAGFDVVAAFDIDPIHTKAHIRNFPQCKTQTADIASLTAADIRASMPDSTRTVDVLFGGPPCQGFSLMGRRLVDDPRNKMLQHFARVVDELRPLYFIVENVEGLRLAGALQTLQAFLGEVGKAGYSVVDPIRVLTASDFGVPQRRKRVFILGHRKDLPAPAYPPSTTGEGCPPCATVWDAIGDLAIIDERLADLVDDVYRGELGTPSPYAKELRDAARRSDPHAEVPEETRPSLSGCRRSTHTKEIIKRFAATAPGAYEPISRYFRLEKEGFAPTLRAGTGPDNGSYTAPRPIHPEYARCITVREAARLHSFPDWFSFDSTIWHGFRQIGNAVPPRLAEAVATTIKKALAESQGNGAL